MALMDMQSTELSADTWILTSFLHETEEVVEKLFSFWIPVEFVELWKQKGEKMKGKVTLCYVTYHKTFN